MPVRKAVDTTEHGARLARLLHVEPPDLRLAQGRFAKPFAGAFELRQGADSDLAQARNQRHENRRGSDRVAECAVPIVNIDLSPAGDGIEGKIGQVGRQQVDQETYVETAWLGPFETSQFALAFQHRQVETAGVTDQHRILAPVVEIPDDLVETPGVGDIGVANAVDRLAFGRYRHAGIDEFLEDAGLVDLAVHDAHRAELNHARLVGIEPGGLAVERDRI